MAAVDEGEDGAISAVEAERADAKARVKNVKVRHMLEMLSSEAGFLIEPSVRKNLDLMDSEEAAILEADTILKALNVDTEDDVNKLLGYFFVEADEEEELAMAKNLEDVRALGLKVKPGKNTHIYSTFLRIK